MTRSPDLAEAPETELPVPLRRLLSKVPAPAPGARRLTLAGSAAGVPAGAVLDIDPVNRLAKIQALAIEGPAASWPSLCADLIGRIAQEKIAEVVYATTRTLSLDQLGAALSAGFHLLGSYPNIRGAGQGGVNALAAWFSPEAFRRRRGLSLHPAVMPVYSLLPKAWGLAVPARADVRLPESAADLPEIEILDAPALAAHRFEALRERRKLSVNFFPFSAPNAVLTSPDEKIQVFARMLPDLGFASILGEHLARPVDPVGLYRRVADLLHAHGASTIEVINDADDSGGIECILRAGFAPCGYFPALKDAGPERRDFVIFARTWGALAAVKTALPGLTAFIEAYRRARDGSEGRG